MIFYDAKFTPPKPGVRTTRLEFIVTFPDFPGWEAKGFDLREAFHNAKLELNRAVFAKLRDKEYIPEPKSYDGCQKVPLSEDMSEKLNIHFEERNITKIDSDVSYETIKDLFESEDIDESQTLKELIESHVDTCNRYLSHIGSHNDKEDNVESEYLGKSNTLINLLEDHNIHTIIAIPRYINDKLNDISDKNISQVSDIYFHALEMQKPYKINLIMCWYGWVGRKMDEKKIPGELKKYIIEGSERLILSYRDKEDAVYDRDLLMSFLCDRFGEK